MEFDIIREIVNNCEFLVLNAVAVADFRLVARLRHIPVLALLPFVAIQEPLHAAVRRQVAPHRQAAPSLPRLHQTLSLRAIDSLVWFIGHAADIGAKNLRAVGRLNRKGVRSETLRTHLVIP